MSDEGSEPPVYDEVAFQSDGHCPGNDNFGYDRDESEIMVEMSNDSEATRSVVDKVESATGEMESATGEVSASEQPEPKLESVLTEEEEEKMLSCLRKISISCTNANVLKRPTAAALVKMMEEARPDKLSDELRCWAANRVVPEGR